MRFIDLFGGVGGFRLGIERATKGKWKCVWYCDNDRYAVQVYNRNFRENYTPSDIRTVRVEDIPDFGVLCAGFPCQSFSIAGKRKGFEDTRGTLFFEIARILEAKRPKMVFLENVKGLLSSKTFINRKDAMDILYTEIECGTRWEKEFTPKNNWIVFLENIRTYIQKTLQQSSELMNALSDISLGTNSKSVLGKLETLVENGLKKRLEYLLIQVSQIIKKQNPFQIEQMQVSDNREEGLDLLLKRFSLSGNSSAMDIGILEKTMDMFENTDWLQKQSLKDSLSQRRLSITSIGTSLITDQKTFGYAQEAVIIAFILKQMAFSSNLWKEVMSSFKTESMFYVGTFNIIVKTLAEIGYDIQYTVLNSKHFGVPQNRERVFIVGYLGEESRPEIFPIGGNVEKVAEIGTSVRTLTGGGHSGGLHSNSTGIGIMREQFDVSGKNYSSQQDKVYYPKGIMSSLPHSNPTNKLNIFVYDQNNKSWSDGKTIGTIQAHSQSRDGFRLLQNMKIRRLTPIECERLQSFPDDWTKYGTIDGKTVEISDTQRYRMMGNTVTVNVIEAIVRKICENY